MYMIDLFSLPDFSQVIWCEHSGPVTPSHAPTTPLFYMRHNGRSVVGSGSQLALVLLCAVLEVFVD